MNERIIQTVLNDGLAPFIADPDRLEAFFQREHHLSATETAMIRAYFTFNPDDGQHGGPPNVIQGYPRSTGPFPCWAILLLADRSQQRVIGDDAGIMDDFSEFEDLDGDPAFGLVRIVNHTLAIDTYVPDLPDVLIYYYHLLRHILFQAVGTLQKSPNFLQQIEFSGADMAPNPQYLPESLWLRRLTVNFITEESAWEPKTVVNEVEISHEDVGGGVVPYEE